VNSRRKSLVVALEMTKLHIEMEHHAQQGKSTYMQ